MLKGSFLKSKAGLKSFDSNYFLKKETFLQFFNRNQVKAALNFVKNLKDIITFFLIVLFVLNTQPVQTKKKPIKKQKK